ncbi:hypothetical protein LL946_10140 [Knoellia locipacati]|uniref:type II secretion system F family protein n=1 Tax=Knoellia locipacati TaxID=882824 RepID=UPI00384AEC18
MSESVWIVVGLVVLAVWAWPRGRPRAAGGGPHRGDAGSDGEPVEPPGAVALAAVRKVLAREVRFRRVRRGWVADFAELAAVGLDSGLPPDEAARLACAVGASSAHPGLQALAARLADGAATGESVGSGLAEVAQGDSDLTFLAAAWRLTDEFGVPAAPAARAAAEVLRDRAAADDRRTVLAAGPRASMWLLTLLPLSGPVVAVLLGLPVGEVYTGTAAVVATAGGLTLTGTGWLWCRALLRRSLRPAGVG